MCSLLTWWREHPPAQLNCSDLPAAIALPTRPSHAHVGTITTSEQSALFRPRNNAESARGPGRRAYPAASSRSSGYGRDHRLPLTVTNELPGPGHAGG